jgi:hypothetical protein
MNDEPGSKPERDGNSIAYRPLDIVLDRLTKIFAALPPK